MDIAKRFFKWLFKNSKTTFLLKKTFIVSFKPLDAAVTLSKYSEMFHALLFH